MARRWKVALTLAAVIAVLAGCVSKAPQPPGSNSASPSVREPQFDGAAVLPAPDMTNDGPGSLVEVKPLRYSVDFDQAAATAVRVIYRSTSGVDGQPIPVSGVVVVPPGKPPHDGWPILSFGHASTGVAAQCAPSLAPDLGGYASVIAMLSKRGYVVAMSDYAGLGVQGEHHSMVDMPGLGNSLIDAARAAHRVVPFTSTQWVAIGTGEGASAAWAAAERAPTYGGGLRLAGAAALSPLANLAGLADVAGGGKLAVVQYTLYSSVIQSLAWSPAKLDLEKYRSDLAKDAWDLLTGCNPPDPNVIGSTLGQLQPTDLQPHDQAAADELRRLLSDMALPQVSSGSATSPVLVAYATEDPLLPAAWTDQSLTAACNKGEPVEIWRRIGAASTNDDLVIQSSLDWLQARLDGQAVADVCRGPA